MKPIGKFKFQHKPYQVIFNPKTKTAFLDPLPDKKTIKNYYQQLTVNRLPQFDLKKELGRLKAIEKFTKKGKLLDVGAGPGYFLSVAKKYKWQVYGTELSNAARKWAKKHYQINLTSASLPQAFLQTNNFDVITFNAVLEHLFDPAVYLKAAYRLLKPSGLLVVRVPNLSSFEFYLSNLLKIKYSLFSPALIPYDLQLESWNNGMMKYWL